MYVLDGPTAADGYEWLPVVKAVDFDAPFAAPAGWLAPASRDGESWVVPAQPTCPTEVTIEVLAATPPPLLLHCFGDRELRFDAVMTSCFHTDPVIQDPAWLANNPCLLQSPSRPPGDSGGSSLTAHRHPSGAGPSASGIFHVTGRFDHPDAETCRFNADAVQGTGFEPDELDEALLRFGCRSDFVIEVLELDL